MTEKTEKFWKVEFPTPTLYARSLPGQTTKADAIRTMVEMATNHIKENIEEVEAPAAVFQQAEKTG